MNKISQSFVFVPCHSMEDFPTHYLAEDARNLLDCWTSTWHPALIATTEKKPGWQSANDTEIKTEFPLLIVPRVSRFILEDGYLDASKSANSILISDDLPRDGLIALAVETCDVARSFHEKVNPELAKDFLALGYAYLQVQIMTRQLRYSSNLNETIFEQQLVVAAQRACQGDDRQAEESLIACFDLLLEEKNCYYPVEPELIDLVLTAHTTLGKLLTQQLSARHATNLLITGDVAQTLAAKNPAAANNIRELIESERISLVGGLQSELPDPLLATESVVRQLELGQQTLKNQFGSAPTVFARRRFGLTPSLPGLLDQFGFEGAIHGTLDDGTFPKGSSSNIRWTGDDGQSILAYGDLMMSADDPAAMLGLGLKIGEKIDSAHVATMIFAHWPGRACEAFEDLIRIAGYGPLLGKFARLHDYFDAIYDPGYGDTFTTDEYKSPYLKQAVESRQTDPISRFTLYWSLHHRATSCRAVLTYWATMASLQAAREFPDFDVQTLAKQLRELELQIDQSVDATDVRQMKGLVSEIQAVEEKLTSALKALFESAAGEDAAIAQVIVNPSNASRRVCFQSGPTDGATKSAGPVVLRDGGPERTDWVVDVPGCGHECLVLPGPGKDPLRSEPSVLAEKVLRNEFFEVHIDEKSGGIRSLQLYRGRKNLIGQQLALRIPGKADPKKPGLSKARYTEMISDSFECKSSSRIHGQITSLGRLVDGNQTVARFEQSVSLSRGLGMLNVEIKLFPEIQLSDSMNHYFCNRLAWKEESATVFANSQEAKHQVATDWFLATQFIEIRQTDDRATLLTGGLPYHRRVSRRMLDSLLIVGQESQTEFRLGLALDLRYPMIASSQWMSPNFQLECRTDPRKLPGGWLYHFDCKNILVTTWRPVFDSQSNMTGLQIRFKETEGRGGKLKLRCPRPIGSASRSSLCGDEIRSIEIADASKDQVTVDFAGSEYFQISLIWAS